MSLATLVRRARPIARQIITIDGVDIAGGETHIESYLEDLYAGTNVVGHLENLSDSDVKRYATALEAAYAIGIAVGLLLREDTFDAGDAATGARRRGRRVQSV